VRLRPGFAALSKRRRAALRTLFGSPPANTVPWLPSVLCGLRGSASATFHCASVEPPPKEAQDRSLRAISQARNTSAIIAARSA